MKNTDFLKEINSILAVGRDLQEDLLKQLKEKITLDIMQEENKLRGGNYKTVSNACMQILKRDKNRPILNKAIIRDNTLQLTDSYRAVIFKKADYINLPLHDEETTNHYPKLEPCFYKGDYELNFDMEKFEKDYKLYKTLTLKDRKDVKNFAYLLDKNSKTYVDIEYLKIMLDIFCMEKEFKIFISSLINTRPIYIESENIKAVLLPLRYSGVEE